MCGIVGYVGVRSASEILLEGLKRLEYRGYDSAGLAVCESKNIRIVRSPGKLVNLESLLKKNRPAGHLGIGHTRWATHGEPSEKNAHPHTDCQRRIALVHNGIVENYAFLKQSLEKEGHHFHSDTDTEVIAHLIEKYYDAHLEEAVCRALALIRGTYGLAVISHSEPNKLVAARYGSPLLIGLGEDENIVASDASAILRHTKRVIYMDEGEVATISAKDFSVTTLDQESVQKEIATLDWTVEQAEKEGQPHFMLKEIFEQPQTVENALRGRLIANEGLAKLGGLESVSKELSKIKRLLIVGCGTAYYSGLVGEYMLEEYAGMPVEVELSSEFRYRKPLIEKDHCALLAISQSGETRDTIAAMQEAKRKGALVLGIVNVVGSTIARETVAGVYNHAGPEIAVASTKAFVSQLTVLALFTLLLGRQRDMSLVTGKRIADSLMKLPEQLKKVLENYPRIQELANRYAQDDHFFYLGRKYNYPIALEGALKLKEISYVHSEGYASGEMKHGPIALIDEKFPTLALVPQDSVYEKVKSNLEEIRARKGKIIAVASEGDTEIRSITDDVIYIPKTLEMLTPILTVVPLQLFAYAVAVKRGCDVDKPRNLAKSVTVE